MDFLFLPFRVHSLPYENELLPSIGAENEYFVRNILCSHSATALRNKVVLESTFHFGFRLETNVLVRVFPLGIKTKLNSGSLVINFFHNYLL